MNLLQFVTDRISIDGWIVIAGSLCAIAAALPGCFLVLRRLSLLGDAISHAVLPGLAVAFFVSGTRDSIAMFVGAVVVGLLTALLTESIRQYGNVDEGASMGVVFTSLFALGLLLIVQAADHVDLDPGCVLYGAIEQTPLDRWTIAGAEIPRVVVVLGGVSLVNLVIVVGLFKELKISAFDPSLATTSGINAGIMHYLLMAMVAVTAVASFESVGNILVVAMFVVPPATALLITDRLEVMLIVAAVVGVLSAGCGHWAAVAIPHLFGMNSTNTAGMMAVAAGCFFALAALFAPRHGVVVRWIRRMMLAHQILSDDILGLLYRAAEQDGGTLGNDELADRLLTSRLAIRATLTLQWAAGNITRSAGVSRLTPQGLARAQALVRSHRLWEHYLNERAGLASDRLHPSAERLEHYTDPALRRQLDEETSAATLDPHGREIPPEQE